MTGDRSPLNGHAITVILGSGSPRRKMILSSLLGHFQVIVPYTDERVNEGESPEGYSVRISEDKNDALLPLVGENRPGLLITADTLVTIDGRILGKPADRAEAIQFIGMLNGRTHRVVSSVTCSLISGSGVPEVSRRTETEATEVTFHRLSDTDINRYLDSIDYLDKAGSYAFQDNGRSIIRSFSGSVTNIIGFPLRAFFSLLAEMGLVENLLINNRIYHERLLKRN